MSENKGFVFHAAAVNSLLGGQVHTVDATRHEAVVRYVKALEAPSTVVTVVRTMAVAFDHCRAVISVRPY